jgi:hypothetical protein
MLTSPCHPFLHFVPPSNVFPLQLFVAPVAFDSHEVYEFVRQTDELLCLGLNSVCSGHCAAFLDYGHDPSLPA